MLRTLRSRHRHLFPALTGLGALLIGALLLQFALLTSSSTESPASQLASADRSDDLRANRGSERMGEVGMIELDTILPTTTTAAPTTTTEAPTTTSPSPTTTTGAPRPAAAPASRAAAAPRPAAPAPAAGNVSDDVWKRLAQCESGMRNDLGAPYYGYFQFSPSTWRGVGGSGLPSDFSYDVQKSFAQKLQARSGWGQWPVCGKRAQG